jgi:hypothetical protein
MKTKNEIIKKVKLNNKSGGKWYINPSCRKEYNKLWYKNNKERLKNDYYEKKKYNKEKSSDYYLKNKERIKKYCKEYYKKNKDKINEYSKSYYKKMKDEINNLKKENEIFRAK